ncbi:hypothetical protein HDU79_005991 [Rhizoclosmatium sp. JEL0117]|nr:hypothetical protein HDU79_005991 [Rhizoclosmatium sp. JEL0117]
MEVSLELDSPFFKALGSLIQSSVAAAIDDKLAAFGDRIDRLEKAVAAIPVESKKDQDAYIPSVIDTSSLDTRLAVIEAKLDAINSQTLNDKTQLDTTNSTNDRLASIEGKLDALASTSSQDSGAKSSQNLEAQIQLINGSVMNLAQSVQLVNGNLTQTMHQTVSLETVISGKLDELTDAVREHDLEMHVDELADGLSQLEAVISEHIGLYGEVVEKAVDAAFERQPKLINTIASNLPSLSSLPSISGVFGSVSEPQERNSTLLGRFRKATSFPGADNTKPGTAVTPGKVTVTSIETIHEE